MVSPVINQCYIQHSDLRNCQKEILITYQTLNGGRFAKQVLCNYRRVEKKINGEVIAWMQLPLPYEK